MKKNDILGADDIVVEAVEIDGWGKVYIRTLTAAEFEKMAQGMSRSAFAALVLSDAEGRRIFADAEIPALAGKSSKAIGLVADAGMRINGLRDDDEEDREKN